MLQETQARTPPFTRWGSLLQSGRALYLALGERRFGLRSHSFTSATIVASCGRWNVSHEVDSHYCPSCLENMPSAEAKLKKHRCANRLTVLAVCTPSPLRPQASPCSQVHHEEGLLLWTSRDVGMADKSVASGGWQEPENPHTRRMNKLTEYYQQLAQKEKVERDHKKLAWRRNYMPLAFSDKYGHGTRFQRPRAGATISTLARLFLKE